MKIILAAAAAFFLGWTTQVVYGRERSRKMRTELEVSKEVLTGDPLHPQPLPRLLSVLLDDVGLTPPAYPESWERPEDAGKPYHSRWSRDWRAGLGCAGFLLALGALSVLIWEALTLAVGGLL